MRRGSSRALRPVPREDPRPPLRRESPPAGRVVSSGPCGSGELRRPASAPPRSFRARSSRTRTCSTSMPPRASCWSSTSRRPSSSSTPIPAASRRASSAADAYVRAREADSLAAFGGIVGLNRPLDRGRGGSDRVDVHRGRHRAVGRRCGAAGPGEEDQYARRRR